MDFFFFFQLPFVKCSDIDSYGDGVVDVLDVVTVTLVYGSQEGDPN